MVFAHLVLHQMTLVSGLTFSEVSMVFKQAIASFATTPMIYVGCSDRPTLCWSRAKLAPEQAFPAFNVIVGTVSHYHTCRCWWSLNLHKTISMIYTTLFLLSLLFFSPNMCSTQGIFVVSSWILLWCSLKVWFFNLNISSSHKSGAVTITSIQKIKILMMIFSHMYGKH